MNRLVLAAALFLGLCVRAQTTKPFFPIGVFNPDDVPVDAQGHTACQTWAARGCNVGVLVPQGHDPLGFDYRCTLAGLKSLRSIASKVPQSILGGVNGMAAIASDVPNAADEPEEHGVDFNAVIAETPTLAAKYPGVPRYMGVSGGKVLGLEGGAPIDAQYKAMLAGFQIVAADVYPVTGWGQPGKLSWVYDLQVRLAALAPNATHWATLECSNQCLGWVPLDATAAGAPTGQQMTAEAYLALIGGAKGIIWFPEKIGGGFAFDNTNADEQAAMKTINAFCATNADFLINGTLRTTVAAPKYRGDWTRNGQVLTLTVDLSAATPVVSSSVAAATPTSTTDPIVSVTVLHQSGRSETVKP